MDHLDRTASVGLDGVVAQQANYARSGFVLAHRNVRFGGAPQVGCARRPAHAGRSDAALVEAVLAYDRHVLPRRREKPFCAAGLRPMRASALAFVEDGAVRGYGVIRACRSGFKIGPLFAEGEREADLLFRALAAQAGGAEVFLDLPEPNEAAIRLAARHGLSPVFRDRPDVSRRGARPAPVPDLRHLDLRAGMTQAVRR